VLTIDPGALEAFQSLALGFALAGLCATGFEALTERRASFQLLETGGPQALASVPLVVLSAPFIILRNTVRGRRHERRHVSFVMMATVIACFWSLICGRVALDILAALNP
jgi:predicted signal transduction protein with EAL and GGDEF domain